MYRVTWQEQEGFGLAYHREEEFSAHKEAHEFCTKLANSQHAFDIEMSWGEGYYKEY